MPTKKPSPARTSTKIGRYAVLDLLGEGGFGRVHRAVDAATGEAVALKELSHAGGAALARFKQEFRALSDFRHPNVVRMLELFEHQGRWFIAMELVEGVDWLAWVRPESMAENDNVATFDVLRLQSSLLGVAQGLSAVHASGLLHRDLKPENIRVAPDGRPVLLDFGLLTARSAVAQSTQASIIGSPAYMAPEQATSDKVSAAADWYALGVCLYEALTGELPFDGPHALAILMAKQQARPEPPSAVALHPELIPPALEELCMALLTPHVSERAGERQVFEALGHAGVAPAVSTSRERARFFGMNEELTSPFALPVQQAMTPAASALAGRESELEFLARAAAHTQQGALRLVLVEGESGIGKSALVNEAARTLVTTHGDTLVLRGRCYENERVPYKAFDGCMDQLARALSRMTRAQVRSLLPPRARLIAQLFPVLADVQELSMASDAGASAEPSARRLEAFRALTSLLHKLALERRLVLLIDDLQWADLESFRLLRALIEEAPPLLILFTVRPRDELVGETASEIQALRERTRVDVLPITGLPPTGARELTSRLLASAATPQWIEAIVSESHGHPLFIDVLTQYAASHELGEAKNLSLDAALAARMDGLDPSARRLLELLALAGRPHDRQIFAQALGAPVGEALTPLLSHKLARVRGVEQLACFHDRVRAMVVQQMGQATRVVLHGALARALSAHERVDRAETAVHWEQAGEPERAAADFEHAADAALRALAFMRAAESYQRALELCSTPEARKRLTVQRAHALARAGRSAEAAALYQEAGQHAEGEERVRLGIWAAQHLLQSAQVQKGMEAARALLAELGMDLPRGERAALARIVWDRARLRLRGLALKPSPREGIDPRTQLQLEAAWQLSTPVTWVDVLPGANISAAHLRRALEAGDPAHAARALAQEATMRGLQRPDARERYDPLLETSRELASRVGDPALDAFITWVEGIVTGFRGEYTQSFRLFDSAEQALSVQCPDEPWLLTNVRASLGNAMVYVGAHRELAARSRSWLAEAVERDDHFARTAVIGLAGGYLRHLLEDAPEAALSETKQSMAAWPREPFSSSSLGELMALGLIEPYRGGTHLYNWLRGEQERLARAAILRSGTPSILPSALMAYALLSAWVVAPQHEKVSLLGKARKVWTRLHREQHPLSKISSAGIGAQLLAADGKTEEALSQTRLARSGLAACGDFRHHPMAYLEGVLEGGEAGKEKREKALAFFRDQGWKCPDRAIQMIIPILPALEAPTPRRAAPTRLLLAERFEVLDALGQGGFGSVTGARDLTTGRRVAIKELTRTSPQALFRFKREFRALQTLRHPRLSRLDALFEFGGRWFIAMQWVEGTDLARWVRPAGRLDAARTCEAFAQLAEGLAALHEAGFCHRDIKPDNVRVTPEGRVVLLDFGLIADLSNEVDDNPEVGTAAYMAPEQRPGAAIGPEADLYAMGVCLYEALCGSLPFDGDIPLEILANKRRGTPPPRPSTWAPHAHIPPDLEALALELLDPRPEARPVAAVLPARLRAEPFADAAPRSRPAPPPRPKATPFAGRADELARLDAELRRTQDGNPRVVLIEGDSGIGKTALVEHWLTRVRKEQPTTQVLRGRCYENEQVPYSALDGIVDELSRRLRRLPPDACAALLPPCAAVLAELFAVLGSVRPIGEAPRKGVLADPHARRLQGFAALRKLLLALSSETPLVLVVDDLQWADLESFRLLHALLREDTPPKVLLVATLRPRRDEPNADVAQAVCALGEWPCSTRIALGPLPDADARSLVARLFDTAESDFVQRIVAQAQGHPLFLGELTSHAQRAQDAPHLTLDAAVEARLKALEPSVRKLLQLVALAGRPQGLHVYERALAEGDPLHDRALDEAIGVLSAARLLQVRRDQQLTCFHDRIRAVAARSVPDAERALLHRALAGALDGEPGADRAECARLWETGGEATRAAEAYEQAGQAALQALAFAHAARLFARALELDTGDPEVRQRLIVQRAHALACGGRSAEAADLYQQAAEHATGAERVRLCISAAQHLLQSAQVEQGMEAARALLSELDMGLPRGEKAALARIAWDRTRQGLRGLALKPTPKDGVDPSTQLKLEAAWQLSAPVAWVEVLPSANLSAAHLRRALDAGDPAHAARALAQEATLRAVQKPFARATYEPLLETSRTLANHVGDPALHAFVTWVEGLTTTFRGEFARALEPYRRAEQTLSEHCPDEPWLLTNVRTSVGSALLAAGEHRELVTRCHAWLSEAREREDRFAHTAIVGLAGGYFRHLLDDAPEAALAALEESMAAWPREPFSSSSLGELWAMAQIEPYREARGLQHWLDRERPRLRRALLLQTPMCRTQLSLITTNAALCAAMSTHERGDLLRAARGSVAKLKRIRDPFAQACCAMFEAQLAVMRGERCLAREGAKRAREAFDALGLYQQHAAGYLEGALEGGEAGRARCIAALAFFREQGWQRPDRALAMVLPVLPEL